MTTPATTNSQPELTGIQKFEKALSGYEKDVVELMANRGVSPKEFMVICKNAIKKNPKLLECEPKSLFGSILTAAELGLTVNTPMGLSFLIPRKLGQVLTCSFEIGYQGWKELVMRHPDISDIESNVVYEKDIFDYEMGAAPKLVHKPALQEADRGKPIYAYAVAYIKNRPYPKFVILTSSDIDKFKKLSQGASSSYSPWNNEATDPMKWMWRKTAIKQLCKELPKTWDVERAYEIDNKVEMAGKFTITEDGKAEVIESIKPEIAIQNAEVQAKVTSTVSDTVTKLKNQQEKAKELTSTAADTEKPETDAEGKLF